MIIQFGDSEVSAAFCFPHKKHATILYNKHLRVTVLQGISSPVTDRLYFSTSSQEVTRFDHIRLHILCKRKVFSAGLLTDQKHSGNTSQFTVKQVFNEMKTHTYYVWWITKIHEKLVYLHYKLHIVTIHTTVCSFPDIKNEQV